MVRVIKYMIVLVADAMLFLPQPDFFLFVLKLEPKPIGTRTKPLS